MSHQVITLFTLAFAASIQTASTLVAFMLGEVSASKQSRTSRVPYQKVTLLGRGVRLACTDLEEQVVSIMEVG